MRISLAWLLALSALPAGVLAQDAPIEQTVHDKPAVRAVLSPTCCRIMIIRSCFILMRATICSIHGPAISIKRQFVVTTGPMTRVRMR